MKTPETTATVRERPIIFSGEMVRAIIDGRKSQTRRVVKPQPSVVHGIHSDASISTNLLFRSGDQRIHCPYGQTGDQLFVKETFATTPCTGVSFIYRADPASDYQWGAGKPSQGDFRWKPSIFMPSFASRITLELVAVRVERLQDITEEDAVAEGVDAPRCPRCGYTRFDCSFHMDHNLCPHDAPASAIPVYAKLWEAINAKKHPWESNPWVWVLTFKRIKP